MKIFLQTLILVLIKASITYGQVVDGNSLKCTYQVIFQPDSTDNSSHLNENTFLFIRSNGSQFVSQNLASSDSLKSVVTRNFDPSSGVLDLSQMNIPRTRFNFFINKSASEIDVYNTKYGWYKYSETPNEVCWNIGTETKEISGYKCQMASTTYGGRDYVAWFTTDIPYSNGPYVFMGLPGLIVKISDTRNHYVFTLTHINKYKGDFPMKTPDNYTETTKVELFKYLNEYRQNPIAFLQQYGGIDLTPETIRRIKDRERKRNNPIELKMN